MAFAYNTVTQTGGQIKTSPELSTDGTKVAFVESTSGGSYFHVLVLPNPIPTPPSQSGTVLSPLTPSSCTTPTTAGLHDDTRHPNQRDRFEFVALGGLQQRIRHTWAPTMACSTRSHRYLAAARRRWSTLGAGRSRSRPDQYNTILTAPVVDDNAGHDFHRGRRGLSVFSQQLTNPANPCAQQTVGWVYDGTRRKWKPGTGIVDPPIAVTDPANPTTDQVFVIYRMQQWRASAGQLPRLPANFTTSLRSQPAIPWIWVRRSGDGDCTGGNVHSGAFDNAFWLNGSTSGHMIACGFVQ